MKVSTQTSTLFRKSSKWSTLVSLKHLSIRRFTSLHVVECGTFKHLSDTLISLDLSENSIAIIEQGALKCLTQLKELNLLNNNQFTQEQLDGLKNNGEVPSDVIFA
jgi:hypothetical protein